VIRDILLYPDKRLETPCKAVGEFGTGDLRQLIRDMFDTTYGNGGLGLAAPQIGIMEQVAVIDPSSGKDFSQRIVLINPIIADMQGTQCSEEGCLSFPGFTEKITRSMTVTVDARDSEGGEVHLAGNGLLARAFQHEIDHLNGILFIQRMSSLKRELIRRKIRRMLHAGDWRSKRISV
jgi:peptide deformylase